MTEHHGLYHRYITRCRHWSKLEGRVVFAAGALMVLVAVAAIVSDAPLPWWSVGACIAINLLGLFGVWSALYAEGKPRPAPETPQEPPQGDETEPR